jgi:hypothetical protein
MRRFLLRGLMAAAVVGMPAVALADPLPGPRVRPAVGPLSDEALLGVLRAEKDAYTRRMEVCNRLREIALNTNDEKLDAKINELERQATAAYHERVSRLGVKSGGPLPPVPPSAAAVAALQKPTLDVRSTLPNLPSDPAALSALEKSVGTGMTKTPLDSTKPASGKTVTAKAGQFKEVAP